MGAGSSKAAGEVGELAGHYNELVDSMMKNQLVFDVSARNIARTEQEWFRRFEQQLEAPPATEDALYSNISRFMAQSQQDVGGIVDAITDPAVRESARQVLDRTRTSVAMQKYYEYKYLHLSAVFLHFTEFVGKLMEIMSQGLVEATQATATSTADDIKRLLDAIGELNLSRTEAEVLKQSVRNVHGKAVERLDTLSRQMKAIAQVSGQQVRDFPAEQMALQKEEERREAKPPPPQTQPQTPPQTQPQRPAAPPQPQPPSGLDRTFAASGGGSPLVAKGVSDLARALSRITSGMRR